MPALIDSNRTYATKKLRVARQQLEITQTELAELLKVKYDVRISATRYQKIENQEQPIASEHQIAAIARILKLPISELFEVRTNQ